MKQGAHQFVDFELSGEEVTVGRSQSCVISIPDPSVSRVHFKVVRQGDQDLLLDSGSANGTFVNQFKVSEAFLNHGDEILIGRIRLYYSKAGDQENREVDLSQTMPEKKPGQEVFDPAQLWTSSSSSGDTQDKTVPVAVEKPALGLKLEERPLLRTPLMEPLPPLKSQVPASVGLILRFVALLMDLALLSALGVGLFLLLPFSPGRGIQVILSALLLFCLYRWIALWGFQSTLGNALMGLSFRRAQDRGAGPSPGQALAHAILTTLFLCVLGLPWLGDVLDRRDQWLHDRLSGLIVWRRFS